MGNKLDDLLELLGTDQTKLSVFDPRREKDQDGWRMMLRGAVNSALSNTIDAPANIWNAGWGRITGKQAPTVAGAIPGLRGQGAAYDFGSSAGDAALALGALRASLGAPGMAGSSGDLMPSNQIGAVGNVAKRNMKRGSTATVFDAPGLSYDDALAMARRNAHLKQTADGHYVGAPAGVDSPQALGTMRANAGEKVRAGVENAAWYDRARGTGSAVSGYDPVTQGYGTATPEGRMASLFSRGGAAYSPQATPAVEVNSFLKQHNAKVVGAEDIVPRTGSQSRNVAQAYAENPATGGFDLNPQAIRLGKKTGPYADAKDPTVDPQGLYRTANDIWHGRVFGYKNSDGSTFSRGFTPQEHGFLTGENLRLADWADKQGLRPSDASDLFSWDPRAAQAATWGAQRKISLEKARDAAARKYETAAAKYQRDLARWEKGGKVGDRPKAPTKPDLASDADIDAQATFGIDNATAKHVASMTYEYAPGAKTGHLAGLLDDPKALSEYTDAMRAAERGREVPLDALQLYRAPTAEIPGEYTNSLGRVERNRAFNAQPLVGLQNADLGFNAAGKRMRGGQMVDGASAAALDGASSVRSVFDVQEGVGWNKFTPAGSTMKSVEKTGLRVEAPRASLDSAKTALRGQGLDVVDLGDALHAGNFGASTGTGKQIQAAAKKALGDVDGHFYATPGRWETGLQEAPWTAQQGTGNVTRWMLDRLSDPRLHNYPRRLDSAGFPAEQARKLAAELEFAKRNPQYVPREDVLRLREVVSKVGLEGLPAWIEKNGIRGLPAVGGVSLSGLLSDEEASLR